MNEEGLFTCPPNRAIFATEEMAKAGYLSQLDYSKVVEMGDFYTVLNGDIVAVGFDPETGESRSLTDGESARVEGYFTVISEPGSGEKAVDAIRHGMEPCGYDISVETHDMASGKDALLADVDEDGFPLIAALRPGGNAVSEGRSVGGTIVCSFYGKPENYFRFKMQQMPQRVLYQDIEKGRELDARAKLQLFGGNIASPDFDRRIIRPPECIVKLRADTPQMETHGRETSRVRRESRDMASGRAALDAGRRAETARVTERHIDSNLK